MNWLAEKAGAYAELCKLKIALLSSLSAAAGYVLAAERVGPEITALTSGVFFLACGASALNQYQERGLDLLMPRTMNRPLPAGRIAPVKALLFSALMIVTGVAALFLIGQTKLARPGIFAVVWYNGLYTNLKKKSSCAIIPGALAGAAPVLIGWTAGGGDLRSDGILMLCFFFFMWQVPHSLLFSLRYGTEYEAAAMPSLTAILSRSQLLRINFIWTAATAVSCLFLVSSGVTKNSPVNFCLVILSAWLFFSGARLPWKEAGSEYSAFRKINAYLVLVLALLASDRLFFS